MEQFNQFACYREEVKDKVERIYGPLQQYGNSLSSPHYWNWNDTPWPWQV
ncbi:spore coat protein CotJB [Thalassobacillus sp. C254]|nr:spore coat protein CotJB [Thalassobacillus sp. C254]